MPRISPHMIATTLAAAKTRTKELEKNAVHSYAVTNMYKEKLRVLNENFTPSSRPHGTDSAFREAEYLAYMKLNTFHKEAETKHTADMRALEDAMGTLRPKYK